MPAVNAKNKDWEVVVHLKDGRSAPVIVKATCAEDAEGILTALREDNYKFIEMKNW